MEFHDFDQLLDSRIFETQRAVISIGVFDGIHIGHQAIISAARKEACGTPKVKTVVFTFAQNPKMMLSSSPLTPPLLSMRQAEELYEQLEVDIVVVIDFSPDFSKLSGEQFIERCTQIFDVQAIVVGDNFKCGYRGTTGPQEIREYLNRAGRHIKVIVPTTYRLSDGTVDSSTVVRSTIKQGDMGIIPQLLGRYHSLDLGHIPSSIHEWPLRLPIGSFMQLLPPPGMYEGYLRLNHCSQAFSCHCCISPKDLEFSISETDQRYIQQRMSHESYRLDSFEFTKEKAQTC